MTVLPHRINRQPMNGDVIQTLVALALSHPINGGPTAHQNQ